IDEDQEFLKELRADDRIANIQQFATKSGIIKTKTENEGILLKGIGPDYQWGFIKDHIVNGKAFDPAIKSEDRQILISKYLSDRLGLLTGDKMFIYFITSVEVKDSVENADTANTSVVEPQDTEQTAHTENRYRVKDFIITGVYETGLEDFDKQIVFTNLDEVKNINGWRKNQTGGFEINLKNMADLDESEDPFMISFFKYIAWNFNIDYEKKEYVADKVYEITGNDFTSQTVKQSNPAIFEWLAMHDTTAIIVLVLMILVSVINMVSALIILIIEKTNMIGIIKAMGMSNKKVKRIFLTQAVLLIGKGMLWGNILGLGIAFLQNQFHFLKLDQSTYYISFVPVNFEWWYLIFLNLGTFGICLLCMLLPVIIVARTTPIKAIRFN
ncbi:MAG: ABC transporter permease, partial [Bacteroidia bacterium]|nr:ABC transporter permease [Bacteroidia bacterium]